MRKSKKVMLFKSTIITLIGALAVSGIASADLTSGLAAHYNFDSCTAADSSGKIITV